MSPEGTFFRPYADTLWWRYVRPFLYDMKWRDQVCNALADRGFAQLVYYHWRFVVHRLCFAIERDQHCTSPQWHIGSIEDAVRCMEQMLMPYSVIACGLKETLKNL